MGGDEFAVLLAQADKETALAKAQRDHLVQSFARRVMPDKEKMEVQGYDKNGDGLVQENEVPPNFRRRIMRRYDKDGDKVLNKEEQAELQRGLNALRGIFKR